jgi:hypothetical protein
VKTQEQDPGSETHGSSQGSTRLAGSAEGTERGEAGCQSLSLLAPVGKVELAPPVESQLTVKCFVFFFR